jgi:NTE family protein
MTTAFVLSGGGSLGAIQAGGLRALVEAGITPDLVVGSSAGAVNGAWLAGRPDLDGVLALADVWRGLSRAEVFPTRPLLGLLGLLGRRRNLVPDSGLRRLLMANVGFEGLEDASIPLAVVATDVLSGADVLLSTGDAVQALLASTAIPGVLPPVRIDGRELMDGGVVNNTPISHAVALGADTVWVLPAGHCFALPAAPATALGMALHALTLTLNQRLALDVERFENVVDLRVVPPLCEVGVSPADFGRADELIARAHDAARRWLAAGPLPRSGQASELRPHGPPAAGHTARGQGDVAAVGK